MEEPSVLDYLKSKLMPWKGIRVEIPEDEPMREDGLEFYEEPQEADKPAPQAVQAPDPDWVEEPDTTQKDIPHSIIWPWRSLLALSLALMAQSALAPPTREVAAGVVLYTLAVIFLIWANLRGEWQASAPLKDERRSEPLVVNVVVLTVGVALALVAFVAFGGNRFTFFNLLLWLAALIFFGWAFWRRDQGQKSWTVKLCDSLSQRQWHLTISWWTLVVILAIALSAFFRFYRMTEVPPEMVSDHAEKLLDVSDVLNGQTNIFFPRNTGREAFQMYLTAAVALLFGTGLSFTSLKIGTVLCGLLTLPYIYLLGKEIGNRQVGLWAMVFAGIAYWPNLISRIALRFTLYSFFVAPTLYYLIRGLRTRNRNYFILSGLFLGIGLHGYSPFRFVPILVLIAVVLYLLHKRSSVGMQQALFGLLVLVLISLVVFLPLLRYSLENPDMISYRAMTRFGDWERPLPGSAWKIFLQNLWDALAMFAWDNGQVWVISVTSRPVLDVVAGALFHLGLVLVLLRYFRRRNWLDLFLLISIPILMMPSVLSLAFPGENPSLNRTAGALVPVFLIVGIAMEGLTTAIANGLGRPAGARVAWGLGLLLLVWSSFQNYDLVFNQYQTVYRMSSWNTSEMGGVVNAFSDSVGSADTAWLVAYPHWADSRLVGINAGYPTKDLAIWPEHFRDTIDDPRAKLFLINVQDEGSVDALRQLYPQGALQTFQSQTEGRDFLMYFVPPQE